MGGRRIMAAIVAAYAIGLVVIALWPTHVDENLNVVDWAWVRTLGDVAGLTPTGSYRVVEVGANVLLFVPFGLVASQLLRAEPWWMPIAVGAATSSVIELAQRSIRPDRTASLLDVAANTAGVALGVLAHRAVVVRERSRAAGHG